MANLAYRKKQRITLEDAKASEVVGRSEEIAILQSLRIKGS